MFTIQDAIESANLELVCLYKERKHKIPDSKLKQILIGDSHISGFTKSILNKCFDVGVIGEGEETLKVKMVDGNIPEDIRGALPERPGIRHQRRIEVPERTSGFGILK